MRVYSSISIFYCNIHFIVVVWNQTCNISTVCSYFFSPGRTNYGSVYTIIPEIDLSESKFLLGFFCFITCIDSYNHHHNQGTEIFHHRKHLPHAIPLELYSYSLLNTIPNPWKPLICFSISITLSSQERYIKGIL